MSQTWFSSDWHFTHRLMAELRGFSSVKEHDDAIIANINKCVKPEDTIWVLGDVGMGPLPRFAHCLDQLNGRAKHLITGNHDEVWPGYRDSFKYQEAWFRYFDSVQAFARRKIDGKAVLLSHFPYEADHTDRARYVQYRLRDEGEILLHGHTHGKEKLHGREIHAGLDAWGLMPVPMQDIQKLIAEISSDSDQRNTVESCIPSPAATTK
jgi:calcineurin-like phosphoesterase family protein